MKKCYVLAAVALALARIALGDTSLPSFRKPLPSMQERQATVSTAWASEPWTGDDRPYALLRDKIDQQMASGQSADKLRIRYGALAEQRPEDPLAQFAWAYAAEKASVLEKRFRDRYDDLYGVDEALAHVKYPRTYNFARVRFLVEDSRFALTGLGERLLQRDSGDDRVKKVLIDDYDAMIARRDIIKTLPSGIKERAISYANDLIREYPARANYVAGLGMVYLACWERSHDAEDGRQAVAALQQYIQRSPPDDEFSGFAREFIHNIESYQG